MKIGIISDTHGKLHLPVLDLIAACDVVLHAGDVDKSRTLDQLWMHLKPNAPFYLVRGNNDRGVGRTYRKNTAVLSGGCFLFHGARQKRCFLGSEWRTGSCLRTQSPVYGGRNRRKTLAESGKLRQTAVRRTFDDWQCLRSKTEWKTRSGRWKKSRFPVRMWKTGV